MSRKGRRPAYTKEQRERVLALAAQGRSQREIAEEVFWDGRYRGRVERILRRPVVREMPTEPADSDGRDFEALLASGEDMAVIVKLVARYEQSLLESDAAPSLGEIDRLLRIKRVLAGMATVARLNALVRNDSGEPEGANRAAEADAARPSAPPLADPDTFFNVIRTRRAPS